MWHLFPSGIEGEQIAFSFGAHVAEQPLQANRSGVLQELEFGPPPGSGVYGEAGGGPEPRHSQVALVQQTGEKPLVRCTSPSRHEACCPGAQVTEQPLHASLAGALQVGGGPSGATTAGGEAG